MIVPRHDEHIVQTSFWEDHAWEEIGRMLPQPCRQNSTGEQQPCVVQCCKLERVAFQESKKACRIEMLRNNNSALNHLLKW